MATNNVTTGTLAHLNTTIAYSKNQPTSDSKDSGGTYNVFFFCPLKTGPKVNYFNQ